VPDCAEGRAESAQQVIREFFDALNDRRLDDLPRYMAAGVIDHNKIIHGEADEPGAAFEGFRQQLAAFSDARMQVCELMGEGAKVAARLLVSGVHTGAHPRMPQPAGRRFEVEQIWIFTVRGGKISEIRAVSDRLGLFLQLGWDWPAA
jgi:predicted ester cyclase